MNAFAATVLAFLVGLALTGCQSSQSRQTQLAQICTNPVNRQPGNFYFSECQSLYPSTSRQLQKDYLLGAPSAN